MTDRRIPALLLALLAWAAVGLQLVLSLRLANANGKPAVDGLVAFFGYFTVLTNLFVALVATAGARGRADDIPRGWYRPRIAGCATTAIVVVGLGYHLLLREAWDPQGAQWLADMLLHYAVPIAAALHWFAYPHRERLPWSAPLSWCAYPVGYFAYALVRGAMLGSYPYPFLDVTTLGYPRVAANGAGLLLVFFAAGLLVVAIARVLHNRRRTA